MGQIGLVGNTLHGQIGLVGNWRSFSLEILLKQIRYQITDLTAQKKGLQERRLAERKEDKAIVSFEPIYEFALAVFNGLDKLKAPDWKKVSIALAIATGRRMAEIHLTSSQKGSGRPRKHGAKFKR